MNRLQARVLNISTMAPGTISLEIERAGLEFFAGQEIVIHVGDPPEDRSYSIASGERDENLCLLIRVIPDGLVSPRLAALQPGDIVSFSGPTGSFTLRDPQAPCLLIATGTGIAPFRSFLRTYPELRPIVLHGVRTPVELYWRSEFEPRCAVYMPCISRWPDRPMRVTDALEQISIPLGAHIYICGGHPMIRAAREILLRRGVPPGSIFTEAYFYW